MQLVIIVTTIRDKPWGAHSRTCLHSTHISIQAVLYLLQQCLDMADEGLWLQRDTKLLALLAWLVPTAHHTCSLLHIPGTHLYPYWNPLHPICITI